jgi:hypothetical protein
MFVRGKGADLVRLIRLIRLVRLVRLVRLIRLIRLVRLIRTFPHGLGSYRLNSDPALRTAFSQGLAAAGQGPEL